MKSIFLLSSLFLLFSIESCGTNKDTTPVPMNKTPDYSTGEGKYIISAEIVQHSFVNKAAKVTDRKEYYVRRSVQDYFIKFCESSMTEQEFEKLLNAKGGVGSSFNMEVEIKEGFYDSCDPEEMVQSRTGTYMVIHKIID